MTKIIIVLLFFTTVEIFSAKKVQKVESFILTEALLLSKKNPEKYEISMKDGVNQELCIALPDQIDFGQEPFKNIAMVKIENKNPDGLEANTTYFYRAKKKWVLQQFDHNLHNETTTKHCNIL